MKYSKVPEATIRRLSRYSRCLEELEEKGEKVVSSAQLASRCAVNSAQVRKDLAYFGEFGIRGVGYYVKDLLERHQANPGIEQGMANGRDRHGKSGLCPSLL